MAPRETRISVRGVAGLVHQASLRGIDAAVAWRTLRSDPGQLRDPDASVDVSDVHALWEFVDDRLRDPAFPIQVAQAPRTSDQFGLFGFVMLTSPTAGEAFARATRFLKLFSTGLDLTFERVDGGARTARDVAEGAGVGPGAARAHEAGRDLTLAAGRRARPPVQRSHVASPPRRRGARFGLLADATLEAIARRHLEQGALAISEIAWTLGDQAPNAFHLTFQRWTGLTPGEFRASPTLRTTSRRRAGR